MPNVALTLTYDALLSTTVFNIRKVLEDNISTTNAYLFYLMRRSENGYKSVASLGERAQYPLMYALTPADSYAGYDVLSTTPQEGITSAFFDWRQCAVPITISRIEERKNSGEHQTIDLLKAKTKQSLLGIQDYFGKGLLRGNGTGATRTAKTSVANGSLFVEPLHSLVDSTPTTSRSIGSINQSTAGNEYWRNVATNSAASTYAGFLKDLRKLFNDCSKGPGGGPDLHVTDQNTYELYEAALANAHRNPTYQSADIPFDNILFKGKPVTWDEFVPDASGDSITQSTTSGTWWSVNTKFLQIQYDAETNWITTAFQKPEDQDAKTAHILWYGAHGTFNRRKHGLLFSIDTTLTS